ncbi:MAG TPA: hypothetical protein VIL09_03830 [Microvirga sp.]|jgi:hypothetical protein
MSASPRQAACILAAGLALLVSPCAAGESRIMAQAAPSVQSQGKGARPNPRVPTAPRAEASPAPSRDVEADSSETKYIAARAAAEKREREWDRKLKQLVKDVCTGC